jgi:hypothetical protein
MLCTGIVLLLHFSWLSYNSAVETWDDDAGLFKLAMCFADGFQGRTEPCSAGAPYPPLVPFITSIHFVLTGVRSLPNALFSLWPFLLLLCTALFLGLKRAAGTMAGLAGIMMGPVVVWSLHIRGKYYTEVPLAALVVASIVALAASDQFRNRFSSGVLGLLLGLGLMTKWSFAFFLGPVAAIAVAIGIALPFHRKQHRTIAFIATIAVPVLVAGGAANRIPFGLTMGVWLTILVSASLVFIARQKSDLAGPEASSIWLNVGMCVGLCIMAAGPWYWTYLPTMQEFLAANLSQKFHGDPLPSHMGWPFYPAVILTRVMSTPLSILFMIGVVVGILKKRPPLLAWSLLALLSGALILGFLPYRSGRYIVAGLGLIVPVVVLAIHHFRSASRIVLPILFASGLIHQSSWIILAFGGAHIPHHLSVFTLPERDLMGNTHEGVYQAYQDLLHPRWRFLPVASPPVQRTPASAQLASVIHNDGGSIPHFVVVKDSGGSLNLNAMRTHMLALDPPLTSEIVTETISENNQALRTLAHRARHPRDQPATASGPAVPRQLYIVDTYNPEDGPRPQFSKLLHDQGWTAIARNGVISGFEPLATTIWKAPSQ